MKPIAFAATDIGRVKDQNEDNFLVDKHLRLFVVADGMGGHAAGEVASEVAVREIRRHVTDNEEVISHFANTGEGREMVLSVLEMAVRNAGRTIHQMAQDDPAKRGMGTTVSLLLITPQRGFIAHVGDSRVYLVRDDAVFQLTEDHSLINELIRRGRLRPEDAKNAPYKNAVTRAVGVYPDVQVDTLDFEIGAGDNFMLCSDGLTEHLRDDDEIREVMAREEFVAVPERFVELANSRGGKDNITSLVVKLAAGDEAAASGPDVTLKLEVLQGMPLFQHLTYVELVEVLNVSELKILAAGETVFEEGDAGETLYVVLDGEVSVRKGGTELTSLGAGRHFGEMSIMDKAPRSASVVATQATQLIGVGRRPLFKLMRRDKEIAVKFLWCFVHVLNQRLRSTSDDLKQARDDQLDLQDLIGLEEVADFD